MICCSNLFRPVKSKVTCVTFSKQCFYQKETGAHVASWNSSLTKLAGRMLYTYTWDIRSLQRRQLYHQTHDNILLLAIFSVH